MERQRHRQLQLQRHGRRAQPQLRLGSRRHRHHPAGGAYWAGYTFSGWSTGTTTNTYQAGGTYTLSSAGSPIAFSAQWSANATDNYSFAAAGGAPTPTSGSGLDGTTITLPGAPTQPGYTFAGWNDGTSSYGAGATYTLSSAGSPVVFTAEWSANATDEYSFNAAGGAPSPSSGSGLDGTPVTLPGAPTQAGYTFSGWNDGTTTYSAGATYTLSSGGTPIVFTAEWSANATDAYSFNAMGGAPSPSSGSGLDGATITLPGAPTQPGYTFCGWSNGTTTYSAGATYSLSSGGTAIVFTAQWSANATDNYSFNATGGAPSPSSGSGLDGTTITLPGAPTQAGYTFGGWSNGTTTYSAGATYTLSSGGTAIVFTAQWSANATDAYSFNAAGGAPTPRSGSGLNGTTITLPSAPTRAGYTFSGWNNGTTTYSAGATYTLSSGGTAIVFTAQWSANPTDAYSFNAAGGAPTPSSGSGLDGTSLTLPSAPTRAGYTFGGWSNGTTTYSAGATYTLSSGGTAIVFTAQWSANPTDAYSFNAAGGAPTPSSGSGLDGTTITLPSAPTRAGYTFGGWNNGTTTYGAGATYTLSSGGTAIVFTAQWTANPTDAYSFNAAGGAPTPTSGSGLDGTTITLPGAPTRAGYTFAGWNNGTTTYSAGATYTLSSGGTAIVFTAQWSANPTDAYSFNAAGGRRPRPRARASTAPPSPCRARPRGPATPSPGGTTGRPPTAPVPPTPSRAGARAIVFTAQWSTNPTDAYSFNAARRHTDPDLGHGPQRHHHHPAERATRAGYTFGGWSNGTTTYSAGAIYTLSSGGTAIVFTAEWTANAPAAETTTTGLSLSKTSVTYGAETAETFTVTVTGKAGDGYPNGTVTISNSSTTLCSAVLSETSSDSASAICSLTVTQLPVGSYSDVFATYTPAASSSSSNASFAYTTSGSTPAKSFSVAKDTTTTTVSETPSSVVYGDESASSFSVTVTTHYGETVPSAEKVTVKVGTATCTVTLSAGKGTCTVSNSALGAGTDAVSASYGGDTNLGASSASATKGLTVTKDSTTTTVSESPTTVTTGAESASVFSVTVTTHYGETVPSAEKVTVKVGTATCTVTLSAGKGSCTIAKSALGVGTYAVSASYGGDTNLSASSASSATELTVKKG